MMTQVAVEADVGHLVTDKGGEVARRFAGNSLFDKLGALGYDGMELWAWDNYRATILAFARHAATVRGRPARLLEIGGSRLPLFTPDEARAAGLHVTTYHNHAGQLARAAAAFRRG